MSKIPQGYRNTRGCHNCRQVFVKHDYDQGNEYFCCNAPPPRPVCGSVAMDERFSGAKYDSDKFDRAADAWDEWSDGRAVEPWGKCPEWEATP